ncbi:MAG: ABC transporter permease, partial [Desulfovibrionaceae bacterium]
VWVFTGGIYSVSKATSQELHNAPIAVVDEDRSQLSARIAQAFYQPYFKPPVLVSPDEMDHGLDSGRFIFGVQIPPDFERDVMAGRTPDILVNIDATCMSQAFIGATYIQKIALREVLEFVQGRRGDPATAVSLAEHIKFNPNLTSSWFGSIMELTNNITMLAIMLTGAALVREREHGTLEHLMVMPVTAGQIVGAKIWSMAVVILAATAFSLYAMVQGVLGVPIAGSIPLFLAAALLQVFAMASLGILLGTMARNMPQLGLMMILVLLPLDILSGGVTPRESMPELVQDIMLGAPTTHFVALAQGVLYRGAGLAAVWPRLAAIAGLGGVFFLASLALFRRSLAAER